MAALANFKLEGFRGSAPLRDDQIEITLIFVNNTSPATNLAAIGQFDLLHQLYARIHIAEVVWDELNARGIQWPGSESVAAAE